MCGVLDCPFFFWQLPETTGGSNPCSTTVRSSAPGSLILARSQNPWILACHTCLLASLVHQSHGELWWTFVQLSVSTWGRCLWLSVWELWLCITFLAVQCYMVGRGWRGNLIKFLKIMMFNPQICVLLCLLSLTLLSTSEITLKFSPRSLYPHPSRNRILILRSAGRSLLPLWGNGRNF